MSDIKPEEILDTSRNEPITENPKEGGIFKEEIPPEGGQSTSINMTPMTSALNENQDNTVNKNECSESFSQQPIFYNRNTKGWRARIAKNMI